jgi:hypothetical protein
MQYRIISILTTREVTPLSATNITSQDSEIFINPVPTSQKTHNFSITLTSLLILFSEIMDFVSHTRTKSTLCGQNVEFLNTEAGLKELGTLTDVHVVQ